MTHPISEIDPTMVDRASDTLTQAFMNEHGFIDTLPDDAKRERALRDLWPPTIRYCLHYGTVIQTPHTAGVSCWVSPGNSGVTTWRIVRYGFTGFFLRMETESRRFFLAQINEIDRSRKRSLSEDYWYLWAVGVRPESQRQGMGAALIEPMLARCRAEGVPAYLEAKCEKNVRFYEGLGFEILHAGLVPKYDYPFWLMIFRP